MNIENYNWDTLGSIWWLPIVLLTIILLTIAIGKRISKIRIGDE